MKYLEIFLNIIFLYIEPGYTVWSVDSEVGGTWYIGSAAGGSLCPADQRNNYSHRTGRKSWRYKDGSGDVVEAGPGNIRLTCTKNN